MIWGWHYSISRAERIRKPLFEGEMIVFAGSFLTIGIFFVATRRTKAFGECGRSPRLRTVAEQNDVQ